MDAAAQNVAVGDNHMVVKVPKHLVSKHNPDGTTSGCVISGSDAFDPVQEVLLQWPSVTRG